MDPDDLALFILIEERLATRAVLDRVASRQLGEAWILGIETGAGTVKVEAFSSEGGPHVPTYPTTV